MHIIIPDQIRSLPIWSVLAEKNFSVRLVGGCVRDILLNRQPKDYDFATDARPDQMIEAFTQAGIEWIGTGLQHGTISTIIDKVPYEITTLRIDVDTDGRHAEVEFTADWQQDALRRDFTINAMSADRDGLVYDYFDGLTDITLQWIRFVGDAESRIREDYLRILRYFRFRHRFKSGGYDRDTWDAITRTAPGLTQISGERIWREMREILSQSNPFRISVVYDWMLMYQCGIFSVLSLPDPDIIAATEAYRLSKEPITVLASMIRYDTKIGDAIIDRWKLSRDEADRLRWLVDHKVNQPTPTEAYLKRIAVKDKAKAVETAAMYGNLKLMELIQAWRVPAFPIRGQDMLDLGYDAGPRIGKMLHQLNEIWHISNYTLDRDQLIAVLEVLTRA